MSSYYLLLLLFIPAVYIILSFIFLRKPHWIHKRRRPAFVARNIGHRGGAGECIENSLAAFDSGLKNGAEMLELDCHLTKDGQVVVHHDDSIRQTTGVNKNIRDVEYRDLPKLNSNIQLYYDSEITVSCEDDDVMENNDLLRIPLLKDIFERYPLIPINIDVKENDDELIRQVSALIKEYKREHLTYWGSFNNAVCEKLAVENPNIVRFCSMKEVIQIGVAYWLGFLPFLPIRAGAFEVLMPGEVLQRAKHSFNWKFRLFFYIIEKALNNKSMFVHLQRRGISVYVWILNNENEFRYAFQEMSVTGVMTDYPSRLQSYLTNNDVNFILN